MKDMFYPSMQANLSTCVFTAIWFLVSNEIIFFSRIIKRKYNKKH